MRQALLVFLLLAFVSLPAMADGPETGVVSGKVTNDQGQLLPGVTVTLSGERGSQTLMTNENGVYRFALLPPGSYVLKASLESFQEAEAVANVTAGGKSEHDFKLSLMTSETITVTSEAPMVDKFNVTAGATITAEVAQEAAGDNRTYYGVVNMLPGVTNDPDNNDIQGTRPTVNGAHFADSAVFIDGVDTTFTRFGGSRVFLPTTATTEISMQAGGSSAEYGRKVGSTTNVIVKSGTNTLHGEFAGTYADTGWSANYKDQPALEQREISPVSQDFLRRTREEDDTDSTGLELSVGGPMAKDKAWFFVAWGEVNTNDLDRTLNDDLVDTSFEFESRIAKVNFQPGSKHQLALSYIDTPAERVYFHPPSGDQYTPTPHDLSGDLASLSWNYTIDNDLFLETKLASQTSNEDKFLAVGTTDLDEATAIKQQDPRFPANAAAGPHWPGNNYRVYIDREDAGSWHNGWLLDNGFGLNEYPRDQANSALTWFASASHEVKFGIDYQEVEWRSNVHDPGLYSGLDFNAFDPSGFDNCLLTNVDANGLPDPRICVFRDNNPADLVAQGNLSSSVNRDLSLYVRDRFSLGDRWTFNVGLRLEDNENENDVERTVVDSTNVSPRLAMSYDVKGDGKMLFSLNAGRYYAQLNQQFTNQWLQEEWNGYTGYDDYLFCGAQDVFLAGLPGNPFGLPPCHLTGAGYTLNFRSVRPGRMWELVDQGVWEHEIDPYYKDEIILGFEWQFTSNWALDVKAISWDLGNMIGNTVQQDPDGSYFFLSANYDDYRRILTSIGFVDQAIIDALPGDGVKEYQAAQIQFNRRFAKGWALYNNVTFADTETTGSGAWWNNTNSDFMEDVGTVLTQAHIDDCQAEQATRTSPADCQALLGPFLGQTISTIHRLGEDGLQSAVEGGSGAARPVIWKTYGFKTWNKGKHSFNLGGLLTFQSGIPWGRRESLEVLPPPDGNQALQDAVNVYLEPNGVRRLSSHYWLNLSGAWDFPIGNAFKGQLRMEVTNVTNQQRQINVNGRGEAGRVRRDFQRPRKFRILTSIRF